MNLHFEDVEVEGINGTVRRYWFDDTPPSAEAKALMDDIMRNLVRESAES